MNGPGIRASGRPLGQLAKRWLRVLDRVDERLKGRIRRGKTLARAGRVQSLDIAPGTVYAHVDDNGEIHRPTLRVRTYEEEEWAQVVELLGQRLELLAALMEGEVDDAFLATLEEGGLRLFPKHRELDGDCDCGDYAVPCAHGAAVHHLLAEALDGDPMLLLALRGRPREQLIAEFRRSWGDTSAAPTQDGPREEAPPPGDWFAAPEPLTAMTFRFSKPTHAPGMLELGPLPGDGDLLKALGPLYEAGADAARELALTEIPDDGRRRRRPAGPKLVSFEAPEPTEEFHAEAMEPEVPERLESPPELVPAEPEPEPEPAADADADLGERLVDLLAEADHGVSTKWLAESLGERTIKVRKELVELEEMGVVSRTGSTRATRWWLG